MDKNFLIAILLTTLIVLFYTSPIYQNMFGSPHEQLPNQTTGETPVEQEVITHTPNDTQSTQTTEQPERTHQPPQVMNENSTVLPSRNRQDETQDMTNVPSDFVQSNIPEHEEIITIENDKLRVELSSQGASITHAYILQHSGPDEKEPAQIVYENQLWNTGGIRDNEKMLNFENVLFHVVKVSDTEVQFQAEFEGGKSITRSYKLDDTGYSLHTSTQADGTWAEPLLELSWEGPINMTEEKPKQLKIWPFSMFIRDENTMYNKLVYLGEGTKVKTESDGDEKSKNIYANESPQKLELKKNGSFQDEFSGDLSWYAVRSKYFLSAVLPDDRMRWSSYSQGYIDRGVQWFNFSLYKRFIDGNTDITIYMGPMKYEILKSYPRELTKIMELSWRFIRPLSISFLWIIKKIRTVIPNWGIVIILFSILIKLVLYPLSRSSIKSMRKMSELQPKMNEIKEKYKNNQQKQQQEIMALYKEEGVNPFGGCLPILLQMPVFFALYPVIGRAFELRQAMFIPGWIEDLSRPDPFYILPVAMGISMFFQSKTTMTDPNQKAMLYIMPIFMVIIFSNFSSGLTLYWFMFNIMTFLQQKIHTHAENNAKKA